MKPTRRQVVIAGVAAGAALGIGLYQFFRSDIDYSVFEENRDQYNLRSYGDICAQGVRLSDSRPVSESENKSLLHTLSTHIIEDIILHGGRPTGNYDINFVYDFYGMVLDESSAKAIATYSDRCVEQLKTVLPSIELPGERLTVITSGQDFRSDFSRRTYIGGPLYRVYAAVITDRNNPAFTLVSRPFTAAFYGSIGSHWTVEKDPQNNRWFTYLSSGPSAFLAPIAERLPNVTTRYTTEHYPHESLDTILLADEAFTESVAFIAAKKVLPREQKVHAERRFLKISASEPKYRHLKDALAWMEKHSPAEALAAYFEEGPQAFVKRISA